MTNWAITAAAKFVEQEDGEAQKWARALHRHQTLVAQAPTVWESVRDALQMQMRFFNHQVGKEVLVAPIRSEQQLTVYARIGSGQRAMTAKFDPKRFFISCSTRSTEGTIDLEERYSVVLDAEDKPAIESTTGTERNPEEVASYMLDNLLGWR